MISPLPSMFIGRVSMRATCGCCSWSSAASSMVMMRSVSGMKPERMFSSVVFPAPVPPEISMLTLAWARPSSICAIGGVSDLRSPTRLAMRSGIFAKRRIDIIGPSSATGAMTALTREPSGSRASTMGLDSSMRRPTSETILSMMRSRCFSSVKLTLVSSSRPRRST
ncbi:hypothetical protein FQZ97_997180 [compost metagenome]